MTDREDEVLNQVIQELSTLPPVDRRAVDRIVSAAVAARAEGLDESTRAYLPAPGSPVLRFSAIVGIAAAAGIVGFMVRGEMTRPSAGDRTPMSVSTSTTAGVATPASGIAADLRPIATQFVYSGPRAHSVRVIGDFNGWGITPATMVRGADGAWSVILPVTAGRHLYAFVVDDSVVLDPGSVAATDPDYGVKRSVIIVGKP